jgi:uncharacterized BrkB/YihY/UPF0761 family membrane protein
MTHLIAWEMTSAQIRVGSMVLACVLLVLIPVVGGVASLARVAPLGLLLVIGLPVAVVVYSGLWLWISWLLPHRSERWTALIPGALAWGGGMLLLQFIAVFVLPDRLGGMSELYGTLAVASSTMAWLFIIGRVSVGAATLNAVLWDRRRKASRLSKTSPA